MQITLPDINEVIEKIKPLKSSFDGESKTINDWVMIHKNRIKVNQSLYKSKKEENDIKILIILLNDLLMRAMSGERGSKIKIALEKNIKSKSDLNSQVYQQVLKDAQYRFPNDGIDVINNVVNYFQKDLSWNWQSYFAQAARHSQDNFCQDRLLTIKGIKFKVRDLALANFNENYVANDLHVARVSTRLGLLNYGFEFLPDPKLEMGNNPSNDKNYLFLHKLFIRLSELTNNTWHLVDFDRMFWHFGRTICNDKPECITCPLQKICMIGMKVQR